MIKENWVGDPNAWLDKIDGWASKKNMAESMRWVER
jgi:hypothetical protein